MKKSNDRDCCVPLFRKTIRIMKITTLFSMAVAFCISASTYAQNYKVSINKKNTSIIEVLKEIERNSEFTFFFNDNHVNVNRKTSVNLKNATLEEVLDQIFRNTGYNYQIIDRQVLIKADDMVKSTGVNQQNKIISGVVTDMSGEPIIGANVVIKGTTIGSITDVDGKFMLEVKNGDIIQLSFIGYLTQEIPYTGQSMLTVKLLEDTQKLEEVIVVGYGTQKKVNMTGAVSQVDSKVLESRPIQNLSSGIQGLMPGVTVTAGQGRPGQDGATIRVRGVGTLNTADPYILVDGIETGTMNSVDPNDIESISVLKDAASAAIYGSKASNGVILITTKRGKTGKPRISYSGNIGFQSPTTLVDRISSYDYATLLNQAMTDAGMSPRFDNTELQKFQSGTDPAYHNNNWYDLAYRTGIQHTHNVNLSGGTDNVKYMGSIGYLHQNGILPNSERQQFNARTNLDMKLTSKLTVRMNLAYIKNDYSDPTSCYNGGGDTASDQIIRQLNRMAPWIVSRYDDGTYGTISDGNPIAWLDLDQTVDRKNQNFSGTIAADYDIMDGLKATLTGSYVNDQQHYVEFQKYIRYNANKESEPNHLDNRYYGWNRTVFDALLNYDKQFGQHGLKALAGWHTEKYNYSYNKSYRKNFPTNDLTDINAGDASTQTNEGYTRELAMISWFARVNYDYAGKYLFEANIRSDASSRFADGHRWGYFPSFSAAWRMNEEGFMEGTKGWLNNLKLRASWGILGNQDALDDYYPWMGTYELDATYPFGGSLNSGYYQKYYKLSTISWEKARTWGIGLDATINNKINATIDYYDRKTTGIIMDVPVPAEFGLEAYKDNVGAMVNRGVEVILSYNNKWGDWAFGATGNFSYNKNKILDLGGVSEMKDPKNDNKYRTVGERLNSYYMYEAKGFFSSDEEAQAWMDKYSGQDGYPFGTSKFKGGDLIYQDTNGDGKITSDDRKISGSSDPSYTYGLNLTGGYKGFDLSLMFTGAAGGRMLLTDDGVGYFKGDDSHPSTAWLDAWTPENQDAKMPRIAYATSSPSMYSNYVSTFWLQNTSYLRLKNLQFGYTFPQNWIKPLGVQSLRVYYSAENLFTISNMLINVDPEITVERASNYPLVQTHSFGVNLTF